MPQPFLELFAALAERPAGERALEAGVARVDITPAVGVPLGGYGDRRGRPSTGVHDRIWARALALRAGGLRLVIVTTDLVGTNPEMVARVIEETGVPRSRLMITATHTHSGPGAYGRPAFAQIVLGRYDQAVFDLLTSGLVRAVRQATGQLAPARIGLGTREVPGFARNRRKAPLVDNELFMMRVDHADGSPMAALFCLPAHGTVLDEDNMEMSGDWMGAAVTAVEKAIPGVTALYANGAEGDLSPNIPDGSSNFEGAAAHGAIAAAAATHLYQSIRCRPRAVLDVREAYLRLPSTLKSTLVGTGPVTHLLAMQVGDGVLVAVPGEMIAELGFRIKRHAVQEGWAHTAIMGLANDHLGYLLTAGEMKKGGYEASMSFFGDDFGETLTANLCGLLSALRAPARRESP